MMKLIISFIKKVNEALKRFFAIILIVVIIFSPYLLIIDFKRYAVIVLLVWVFSAVYFIFVKEK